MFIFPAHTIVLNIVGLFGYLSDMPKLRVVLVTGSIQNRTGSYRIGRIQNGLTESFGTRLLGSNLGIYHFLVLQPWTN